MGKSYDYPASEHIDAEQRNKLREVWAHLTLAATGQEQPMSNTEAAQTLAEAYASLTGEDIDGPLKGKKPQPPAPPKPELILACIHDVLYLDGDEKGPFYDPNKEWKAEDLDNVAYWLGHIIPRPKKKTRIK